MNHLKYRKNKWWQFGAMYKDWLAEDPWREVDVTVFEFLVLLPICVSGILFIVYVAVVCLKYQC